MSPYALNIVVRLFDKSVALFLFSGSNYSYLNCPPLNLGTRVLGPSSTPWGTPTSARPGTDFRAYFIEKILLSISKVGHLNLFLTPIDSLVQF